MINSNIFATLFNFIIILFYYLKVMQFFSFYINYNNVIFLNDIKFISIWCLKYLY